MFHIELNKTLEPDAPGEHIIQAELTVRISTTALSILDQRIVGDIKAWIDREVSGLLEAIARSPSHPVKPAAATNSRAPEAWTDEIAAVQRVDSKYPPGYSYKVSFKSGQVAYLFPKELGDVIQAFGVANTSDLVGRRVFVKREGKKVTIHRGGDSV
jgi:hypothetical protein